MRRAALRGGETRAAATVVLVGLLSGCGGEPEGASWVVGDSAGVEVVESVRPAWGRGEGWRVESEPVVRIGVVEGERAYQLSSVVGAARLRDGIVVVADAGSQEVRFFGSDGLHRLTVGGPGAGPGEFTGLAGLGRSTGGGVWAYDFPLRRVTWLGADGSVAGLRTLGPEPATLGLVGELGDGSVVLKELWAAPRAGEASRAGLRREPVAYVRFGGEDPSPDTIGLFPGREIHLSEDGGRVMMSAPPFARNSVGAVRADRIVVGSQTAWELEEYEPDGGLVRRIRLPTEKLTIDAGDVEAYIDTYVEAVAPERRPMLRRSLEAVPAPDSRPAHGPLLVDEAGNVWVGEYAVHPDSPRVWRVLAADGRWLGEVEVPRGLELLDVGEDWVLGVERDELDVERVVLYRLMKPTEEQRDART